MNWKALLGGGIAGYLFGGKAGAAVGMAAGGLLFRDGGDGVVTTSGKVTRAPPSSSDVMAYLTSGAGVPISEPPVTSTLPPPVTPPIVTLPPDVIEPPDVTPDVTPPPPAQWIPTTADEAIAHGWSVRGPDGAGIYYAISPDGATVVPVTIEPGRLKVNTGGTLAFQALVGNTPNSSEVVLYNDGEDVLEWHASVDDGGVTVSPASGVLHRGEHVEVEIYVATQASAGTRTAHVQFDAGVAGNSNVPLAIAFVATQPPPAPQLYIPATVSEALALGWTKISSTGTGFAYMQSPDGSVTIKLPYGAAAPPPPAPPPEPPPAPPGGGAGDSGGGSPGRIIHER